MDINEISNGIDAMCISAPETASLQPPLKSNAIPTTYFIKPLEEDEIFNYQNSFEILKEIEEKIADHGPHHPEIANIFAHIHIHEEKFDELGPAQAIQFWEVITKLIEIGGHHVQELHIELYESAKDPIIYAVLEAKLKILTSLAELFPKLTALKIMGNGPMIYSMERRSQFLDTVAYMDVTPTLKYLEIPQSVTSSHLFPLIDKLIRAGKRSLEEVSVSSYQLQEIINDRITLRHTSIVRLRQFNTNVTVNPRFPRQFAKSFPKADMIFLHELPANWIKGLANFIEGISKHLQIKVLAADQSGYNYVDVTKLKKITTIPNLHLDVSSTSIVQLGILEQVQNMDQLIIANYDKCCKVPLERILDKVMTTVNPKTCKIFLLDSNGIEKEWKGLQKNDTGDVNQEADSATSSTAIEDNKGEQK